MISYTLLLTVSQDSYHGNADCFVCVIINSEDKRIESRYGENSETQGLDVVDCMDATHGDYPHMFNDINCPQLSGKPRLFFTQVQIKFTHYF